MNPINFLKSRPITLIGIIVLIVGLGPTILAIINIDTTPPIPDRIYPYGFSSAPTVVTVNVPLQDSATPNYPGVLWLNQANDAVSVTCKVVAPDGTISTLTLSYSDSVWFKAYTPTQVGTYKFTFTTTDASGNSGSIDGYATAIPTAPSGNFYINNVAVTTTSNLTFTTRSLVFKYVADSSSSNYVTAAYITVSGVSGNINLTKQSDGVTWSGGGWNAPSDGTWTINGYVTYNGSNYQLMELLGGINTPPAPPTSFTTFDYLKILGVALIVIGLFLKR